MRPVINVICGCWQQQRWRSLFPASAGALSRVPKRRPTAARPTGLQWWNEAKSCVAHLSLSLWHLSLCLTPHFPHWPHIHAHTNTFSSADGAVTLLWPVVCFDLEVNIEIFCAVIKIECVWLLTGKWSSGFTRSVATMFSNCYTTIAPPSCLSRRIYSWLHIAQWLFATLRVTESDRLVWLCVFVTWATPLIRCSSSL